MKQAILFLFTAASLSAQAVYNPTVYYAYGDSITNGTGCSVPQNCYVQRLAQHISAWTLYNRAVGGYSAGDVSTIEMFPNDATTGAAQQPLRTLLIGTNDANNKGSGAYEATFNAIEQGMVVWMTTTPVSRVVGSTATTTGTCANDTTFSTITGVVCTANASTASLSITTTGSNPIYILYRSIDSDAGTFTYKVDATSPVSATTALTTPIATSQGTTMAVALIRVTGITAGTHTVLFTQTHSGTMAIEAVATVPSGTLASGTFATQAPYLIVGEIPNQQFNTSQSTVNAYVADIDSNVSTLAGDGLKVYLAPVSQYLNGSATAADMFNSLHPNDAGHGEVAAAFLLNVNLKAGLASPVAPMVTVGLPYTVTGLSNQTFYVNSGTGALTFSNANPGTRTTVINYTGANIQLNISGPCNWGIVPIGTTVDVTALGAGNFACSPLILYDGPLTLATTAIASGACQPVTAGSVNSVQANNSVPADVPTINTNASIKGFTGFVPVTSGGLTIYPPYVPSGGGYINVDVCNWSNTSITPPSGITLQLKLSR